MSAKIAVLLVDDHALVRQSLSGSLKHEKDIDVLADVGSAHEALTEATRRMPDVIVMDIDMPGQSCFEVARQLQKKCPQTQVVFLSAFTNDHYIEQALSVQALGYVTKNEPTENVIEAIRKVSRGEAYFSPEVMSRIVVDESGAHLLEEKQSRISTLTPREMEILRQIARGLAKKEIADILHISVKTVENHTQSLMNKLRIHDRVQLARFAIREGLAEP